MAAKPSTPAEKALQKIQDQVTCGICLEPYKQPRLLKCFHVFCEQCLQHLVREGQSLPCPQCRQDTPLPAGGVPGLQGAFYIHNLFDIQDALEKKSDHCSKHEGKEAEFYCGQCDQLICSRCLVSDHRNHQYDLVSDIFSKQEKVIVDSLKPVEEQIAMLEKAIESVDARRTAVVEQETAVVAEIRTAMAHLQKALEARETELVGIAEQRARLKLKALALQQDMFERQLGQLRSCRDFVEESRRTCSQGEILRMKSPLVKQVNDLTGSLKPEILALSVQANIKFTHSLPELEKACQQFGEVRCPNNYVALLKRLKRTPGAQRVAVCADSLDTEQKTAGSPFTVTVQLNFTAPASIIGGLKGPWGIAVREGGEVVVAEWGSHSISIVGVNRKKISFRTRGSGPGQFNHPEGVAIDTGGNILVANHGNHRIHQLSSTGKHLRTVGTQGSGPLQFSKPAGITVHRRTGKVYVADSGNHRIQVLNSDLAFISSFGRNGCNNGEFIYPYDVATDGEGNVYVADCDNHRIQVFTADGVYLRQFGKKGELKEPISITIDSHNTVYVGEWGNNCISTFSIDGEFIKSFGRQGSGPVEFHCPFGLAVDEKGTLYVSDHGNNRIQIFS